MATSLMYLKGTSFHVMNELKVVAVFDRYLFPCDELEVIDVPIPDQRR